MEAGWSRAIQRHSVDLIVELSPEFQITRRSVSDAFWEWHERLEQNGTLDHGRDQCPYRNGPVVREWTPSAQHPRISLTYSAQYFDILRERVTKPVRFYVEFIGDLQV